MLRLINHESFTLINFLETATTRKPLTDTDALQPELVTTSSEHELDTTTYQPIKSKKDRTQTKSLQEIYEAAYKPFTKTTQSRLYSNTSSIMPVSTTSKPITTTHKPWKDTTTPELELYKTTRKPGTDTTTQEPIKLTKHRKQTKSLQEIFSAAYKPDIKTTQSRQDTTSHSITSTGIIISSEDITNPITSNIYMLPNTTYITLIPDVTLRHVPASIASFTLIMPDLIALLVVIFLIFLFFIVLFLFIILVTLKKKLEKTSKNI